MKVICGIKLKEFQYLREEKELFLERIDAKSPNATTKLYISVLSNLVEKAERINGRSWSEFSETMVNLAFMSIKTRSEMTLLSYLTIIKDYLIATTQEDDTMKVGYEYTLKLERDDMKKFLNKSCEKYRYLSPKEFDNILDSKTIDPEAKAVAILLYNGIKGESFTDITNIRLEDMDLENGKIYDRNGNILIELKKEHVKYFIDTINKDKYIVYDEDGEETLIRTMKSYTEYEWLKLEQMFLRRFEHRVRDWTVPCDGKFLARLIKDICSGIGNEHLDAQSIYNSGEAYRLLQFCDMKLPTNKQWNEFRKLTGSKISRMTAESACSIILDKINKGE